jgi:hypothetical protein
MTTKNDLKRLIRERMDKTGERYAAARRHVLGARKDDTAPTPKPTKGWLLQGATPHAYALALDPTGGPNGGPCARVRSREGSSPDSAALMQFFVADEYRGSRLRLSARIRTESLSAGCGLWMRLYENPREVLCNESGIRGDESWTRREVVLDIDESITLISFGLEVRGEGTAWLADVAVERVGADVPATASRNIPSHPINLGFVD